MAHIWNWILNFTGINFGQNPFATHMYNFWSGFGGDITEFALIGTLITIYQHHLKTSRLFNRHLLEIMHKKGKASSDE
jgi:hypothetical protein